MNSNYPVTLAAGQGARAFSSPASLGHFPARANRHYIRNAILYAPGMWLSAWMLFQWDWYGHLVAIQYCALGFMPDAAPGWFQDWKGYSLAKIPQHLVDLRAEEMRMQSREKPGVIHKHKLGGQISIPGSEINITEM